MQKEIFSQKGEREREVKEERKGGVERGGEGREESSQHGVKDVCVTLGAKQETLTPSGDSPGGLPGRGSFGGKWRKVAY